MTSNCLPRNVTTEAMDTLVAETLKRNAMVWIPGTGTSLCSQHSVSRDVVELRGGSVDMKDGG